MSSGSGQGPGRVFSPYGDLIVIVVATMISRMIGTPVFSDRMEFSAITGGRMPRKLESRRSQMLRGPQYLQLWEIGPIARNVAREQRQPFDCGVRSDVKVRKWSCPLAATAAMSQETLASQEPGLPGQRFSFVRGAGQSSIQGLDSTKTDGYLGVDNRIDNQGRTVGALCECTSRPISHLRSLVAMSSKTLLSTRTPRQLRTRAARLLRAVVICRARRGGRLPA